MVAAAWPLKLQLPWECARATVAFLFIFFFLCMTQYPSQVHTINATQEQAYARMADLRFFENLKTAFAQPGALEAMVAQFPNEQIKPEMLQQIREQIEKMEFTTDTVTTESQMGNITLAIVEREAPKLVKLEAQGAPVQASLWVQILPQGTAQSALKVTVGVELNFFVRKMIEKRIKPVPDGIASFLSQVLAVPM